MADLDEELDWEGDEEGEELSVVTPGAPPPKQTHKKGGTARRVTGVSRRRGNTPRSSAKTARAAATTEATGRARQEGAEWRESLATGDRGKAQAKLADRSPTHNANSGFGLA